MQKHGSLAEHSTSEHAVFRLRNKARITNPPRIVIKQVRLYYFVPVKMSWLYAPVYLALLIICVTQSFYPIFMLLAMLVRQSRLLYSFFHNVDTTSTRHGGELVAQVLKAHGVQHVFTLPGGHVSPIVVASDKLNIRVIDVRHEATAVFAADASARLSGIPGVAVVTAGPGLTNTVTAIKNAQMAESPVVVIGGAAATMLKGRGSLQDIDQVSLLKSATKKCFTIDCVRDIAPTLREAFRLSQVGTPGPVFVEMPVDILYPYKIIAEQFSSMSKKPKSSQSLKSKIISAYSNYSLNHIFADAWKEREYDSLPVSVKQPDAAQVRKVADILKNSKRPLIIMGSQSVLRPYGPDSIASHVSQMGIPVYLNGMARGLLGSDFPLQFRHARKEAVKEADCVLLLGAVCDFRLSYGSIFRRSTKVISVNRSKKNASLNAGIFWQPTVCVESDVGKFVEDLCGLLKNDLGTNCKTDGNWLNTLRERDAQKDSSIDKMAQEPTESYLNPLKVLLKLRDLFHRDDTILVVDGGDFVASASYIMKPCGPMRWLDPGPYGTLGCGAGFALAAKLLNPKKQVLAIMGDGAFGYAIPELDTFVRHKVPVYWTIGNDACWTQIAREQVPMLGSPIGCELAHTDYHRVAQGFGAKGYKLDKEVDLNEDKLLNRAKEDLIKNDDNVVVNVLIGKTKFRDGSISV
jgi:acetolactate synthase-like protein